jgi:hypothetical protein
MNIKSYKYFNYKNLALMTILAVVLSFGFSSETNAQIIRGHIGIGIGIRAHARVARLHPNYLSIYVGPRRYYYDAGYFYVRGRDGYNVVAAPVGARIRALPAGYVTVRFDGINYYYFNGVYYSYLPEEETYVVVEKPSGVPNNENMKLDRVRLNNGSVVEGVFQGATDNSITIKVGDENRDINISDIVSITFAPTIDEQK